MVAARSEETEGRRGTRLKLRARDAEDLRTIAVYLQDAIVPVSEIAYQAPERRFVLVANRFRWEMTGGQETAAPDDAAHESERDARFEDEAEEAPGPVYERVHCGVCFDFVRGVHTRGFNSNERERLLNLLTIRTAPGAIDLLFSEGVEVRLEVSQIRCHIEDLGEPWPTRWRPAHPEDASESDDASQPQ